MGRRLVPMLAAAVLGLSAMAGTAAGQEPGVLRGTVLERPRGRPVPGAQFLVSPGDWSGATDTAGEFRVRLPEGLYSVAVRRIGYAPAQLVDVRVTRAKTAMVQVTLDPVPTTLQAILAAADPFPRDPEQGVGRSTYSAEEIRRTPGAAGDIFRAIEALPGVTSNGGGFSAFSVRGGGPHDNVILVDDLPFDKVTHLEGGVDGDEAQGGRFGIFAPDLVASADFRAGGFPAQYGGRNAALLSLHLRDGNPESSTFGGRYDLLGWEADYDGPSRILGGTSVLVSARHEDFAQVLKLIGKGDRGHPSFTDVILKSTTRLGSRSTLSVLGITAPERVVRTTGNVLEEADTNDTALYHWTESKSLLGATWHYLLGTAATIQSSVYGSRYTRANALGRVEPDVRTAEDSVASRDDILADDASETQVGFRSVATLTFGRSAAIISLEAAHRRLRGGRSVDGADTLYTFDQYDQRDAPDHYYLVIHPATYDARFERSAAAVSTSLSLRRSVGVNGSATVGARYEHDAMSGHDDVLPRANISFPTIGRVALSVAGGVYLQPTDLRILAASPLNASLPPQRSTHLIAGASTRVRPDVQLSVEGYYRTLSGLPVLRERASGVEDAVGNGRAYGVDVTVIKRLTNRFFGQAGYSYAVSRRDDHRGGPEYDGDGNRPHSLTLLAGYILNARWSFSGKFKVASGQPTDSFIVHQDVLPGSGLLRYSRETVAHNALRLRALQTLNLRVDYQANWGRVGIDAFLDVLNAYDHLNITTVRFAERTGSTFVDGTPIVPTFGLKVLF